MAVSDASFVAPSERPEASTLNTPPATDRIEKGALAVASEERKVAEEVEAGVREPREELAVAVAVVGAVASAVVVAAPVEEVCRNLPCCIASTWICLAIPSPVCKTESLRSSIRSPPEGSSGAWSLGC